MLQITDVTSPPTGSQPSIVVLSTTRDSRPRGWPAGRLGIILRAVAAVLGLILFGAWASSGWARETLEPPTVDDFTRIRVGWSEQPYVQPYWEVANGRNLVFSAYEDGAYERVLEKSEVWLSRFPIDSPVHWMRAHALKAKGDYAGYARHMYWYRGLIASIHGSGNGASPATAFKVVALREEHFLVRDLGGNIKTQELVAVGDTSYHKVQMEFSIGESRTIYFDITIPLAQLERNTFPAPGTKARPGSRPAKILDSGPEQPPKQNLPRGDQRGADKTGTGESQVGESRSGKAIADEAPRKPRSAQQ